MTKLPVWATVTAAYRAIWIHRWALLRFAAIPFVLIVAIELASAEHGQGVSVSLVRGEAEESSLGAGTVERLGPFLRVLAVEHLGPFLGAVVMIAFVVPCYRLMLLGPAALQAPRGSWPARRVYLGVFGLTVLITVLVEGPLAVFKFMLADDDATAWLLLGGLHLAVLVWLAVRLAFLYPAICLGHAWELAMRWWETAGTFWRLLAAYVLALLPLLMAIVLAVALEGSWQGTVFGAFTWAQAFESFFLALVYIAGEAIWAAVTVVAFAHLTGYPAKGVRVPGGPGAV